jgi:hypothetical protein
MEFNQKYVEDVPILNRNFTELQLMAPGSQKLTGWSHAATENPQGGQQIFTQGQHFSGTAFELDGTDNQDPILGIIVVNPNLDAVTEAKVSLQNYDAEFGKAVSSVVTAQTKSGSNDIHGSGPDYPPLYTAQQMAAVWRHHRWRHHQEQAFLLRRLPGHAPNQRRQWIVYSAHEYGSDIMQPGHKYYWFL